MPTKNQAVAQLLDSIARLLTLKREDPYRIRAYTEAARVIADLPDDIEALHRAGKLEEVPGIGPTLAARIGEYLDTGRSEYAEELEREIAPEAPALLEIPSIGPVRARVIHEELGISTVVELERAAREHRLRSLPGIGEALERRIAEEAARALEQEQSTPAIPAT